MSQVHDRAKRGIKLLMGRQVILQLLTFGGGVVLARVLGPTQFGLYAIASFLVNTFALFGDFGLAGSLIQRKEELTDIDLRIAFTMQQALTTTIVIVLMLLSPWLVHFYPKAPADTVWLIRALALNLYLTSWRTMSAMQLERHLHYDQLAKIEVVESLTYQAAAVGLAVTGHGVWSFAYAVLASGIVGTVLVYAASPWKIRFAYDRAIADRILRFGIPFQVQAIVSAVGGWVTPIVVGGLIGPIGVGFVTWASSNGKKPTILVNNVMRVAFPHFSRIQDDRDEVVRTITRYLTWLLIPCGFWFAAITVSSPLLVRIIYTSKWTPAVPCLIVYASSVAIDTINWVLAVSLQSLGLVGLTSRLTIIRNVMSIALGAGLVFVMGIIGVPIAFLVAGIVILPWMIWGLGKGRMSQVVLPQLWILAPTGISIVAGWLALEIPMPRIASAIVSLVVVTATYVGLAILIGPASVKARARNTGFTVLKALGAVGAPAE
jgi:PST family polysaccharide transporter